MTMANRSVKRSRSSGSGSMRRSPASRPRSLSSVATTHRRLDGQGRGGASDTDDEYTNIPVSAENIEDLYATGSRAIHGGVAQEYWLHRVRADRSARESGRLEVIALANKREVINHLEREAQRRVSALLVEHGRAIKDLPDARRGRGDNGVVSEPGLATMGLPHGATR
jgi:hypothetical protein